MREKSPAEEERKEGRKGEADEERKEDEGEKEPLMSFLPTAADVAENAPRPVVEILLLMASDWSYSSKRQKSFPLFHHHVSKWKKEQC